jgi:methylglutaconyl-CoA hydratase
MDTTGTVQTKISQGVATITFGHPAANSFPSDLLQRLVDAIRRVDKDDEVQVIVLKSEGKKVFCSGASFDELLAVNDQESAQQFFSGFANVLNAMRLCSKISIGAVQGKVVGGGVGIVAACDYVFATEKASLKLSELAIGIGPFVIAPAIERKAGLAALSHLALAPTQWQNAYWAKEVGLYNHVYETQSELNKEVELYALQLSKYAPAALVEMKKMLWQNTQHWETLLLERAAISGKLVLSSATKQALEKFKK